MSVIKNKANKQTGIRNNKMMEAAVLDGAQGRPP